MGVLEQVRERALELGGVGAHRRQVAVDRDLERAVRQLRSSIAAPHDLLDRAPLGARLGGVGLQPREVEQVVDQAREPGRLLGDRPRPAQRARARRGWSIRSASAEVRIAVSGERRSCETERSSAVLITSLRRSAAVSTDVGHAARRAPAPRPAAPRARARSAPGCAAAPAPARPTARACRSGARPRAAGRRRCARPPRRRAARSRRCGRSSACASRSRDRRQRLLQPAAAQQQPRHLGRQVGLLAALRRPRAPAGARPRPASARQHRGDEEHDQRDPVLAAGDREAPGRRDVEEVERERAQRPRSRAPARRPRPTPRPARRAGRRRPATARARRRAARRRSSVVSATPSAAATTPTSSGGRRVNMGSAPDLSRGLDDQAQLVGLLVDA